MWPAVELRELHVFLTVAEELHFGHAAERLDINPSRVSQVIRELEFKLGGRLSERTSRRVRLAPLGERLRDNVAPSYEQLRLGIADAREVAAGVAGTLRIGSYHLTLNGGPHMLEIVRMFKARHPGCEVEFVDTGFPASFVDVLKAGEVDMLCLRLPLTSAEITIGPVLSREERILLVANGDPLADHDAISYEEIADRVVSDNRAVSPEMRKIIDAFIPPATPSGRILKRIANTGVEDTLMNVALGLQVHPTVPSFIERHDDPGVTSVPIRDLPPSETALVWLTTNRSQKVSAFARAADDVLAAQRQRNTTLARPTGVAR